MSTLWLDHRDLELRLEPGALVPYIAGQRQRPAPLSLLRRVVIIGNCQLEARIIAALAARGISLAIVSPRHPDRRAWLCGPAHGDATIRLAQLAASLDPATKHALAHDLVLAKARRLLRLVTRMRRQRPDARLPLTHAQEQLRNVLAQLRGPARDADFGPEALRGLEGTAARAGFAALAAVLPPALGFAGRKRRPPPDPANAALSLAYTLLHHRATHTAWAFGLDPLVGFLHEPAHGRESLAADLMEPWRPAVEEWVWRLFAERHLRKEHFSAPARADGACLLGKAGRRIFYQSFERDLAPVFRALRLQTRHLVRRLRAFHAQAGERIGEDAS